MKISHLINLVVHCTLITSAVPQASRQCKCMADLATIRAVKPTKDVLYCSHFSSYKLYKLCNPTQLVSSFFFPPHHNRPFARWLPLSCADTSNSDGNPPDPDNIFQYSDGARHGNTVMPDTAGCVLRGRHSPSPFCVVDAALPPFFSVNLICTLSSPLGSTSFYAMRC